MVNDDTLLQEGFMVVPVPQPQLLTTYIGSVKKLRDHAVDLKHAATAGAKDSECLRKRFLADANIKNGMAVVLKVALGDTEDRMKKMLSVALDDSAATNQEGLVAAFWSACRAPVGSTTVVMTFFQIHSNNTHQDYMFAEYKC